MLLKELISKLEYLSDDTQVVIQTYSPGRIGGSPCVNIKNVNVGFDWDQGKVFLTPETPLTVLSTDDIVAIRESVSKSQSWHSFQELNKLKGRIHKLEKELAELRNKNL